MTVKDNNASTIMQEINRFIIIYKTYKYKRN